MNQGTYPLAAAMMNQLNRVDTISNNLANANTTGFKQESLSEGTFNKYLQRAQKEGFEPSTINTITNNVPKINQKYTNEEVGNFESTGNALDFALISPDTFFKVENENGDIVHTRNGSFKVLDGQIVDGKGNNILNADNEPISIEDDYISQISLDKTDFENLEKIGNNYYKVKDPSLVTTLDSNDSMMLEGTLEESNVNMVSTMVSLIDAHRRFEQTQKAIKGIDETNSKLIDKMSR